MAFRAGSKSKLFYKLNLLSLGVNMYKCAVLNAARVAHAPAKVKYVGTIEVKTPQFSLKKC